MGCNRIYFDINVYIGGSVYYCSLFQYSSPATQSNAASFHIWIANKGLCSQECYQQYETLTIHTKISSSLPLRGMKQNGYNSQL